MQVGIEYHPFCQRIHHYKDGISINNRFGNLACERSDVEAVDAAISPRIEKEQGAHAQSVAIQCDRPPIEEPKHTQQADTSLLQLLDEEMDERREQDNNHQVTYKPELVGDGIGHWIHLLRIVLSPQRGENKFQ